MEEVNNYAVNYAKELSRINQQPQRQDSLRDQLVDLYFIANKFGLYDAATFIRSNFLDSK